MNSRKFSSEFPSRNEETSKVVSRQFAAFPMVEGRLDLPACRVTCLLLDPMELHGQPQGLGQLGEPIQIARFQQCRGFSPRDPRGFSRGGGAPEFGL